jgi:hypothetical protein
MFVAFSFVGVLPPYIIESVYQTRIFFNGDIYLIVDDIHSPYIEPCVNKYNVIVIDYKDVVSHAFNETVQQNYYKFSIHEGLVGREKLFIHSFERFYLLSNLMKLKNLEDCLYLELDNLIYDDPQKWLAEFSKYELCYMFNNYNSCSAGLMYVKNKDSLTGFLNYNIEYINTINDYVSEMNTLSSYYELNKEKNTIQLLPTYWNDTNIIEVARSHYGKYGDSIFDAMAIGIFLLGVDPYHTKNILTVGYKSPWSFIDYTQQQFEWKTDEIGRRKPYVFNGEKWILMNNLHVHSKDLKSGLSINI